MIGPSRINVMAIGVSNYDYLEKLTGPNKDIEKFYNLLVEDILTATCTKDQFIRLENPTSAQFRDTLTKYAVSRTAANDVLVLYFSGHGIPLGKDDFGFCTKDSKIYSDGEFGAVIPLTLVRFSDVIEPLAITKVVPVIIIDACYSGQVGTQIDEIYSNWEKRTKGKIGSAYEVLCACTKYEGTLTNSTGSIFSTLFNSISRQGDANLKKKRALSLNDLISALRIEAERSAHITPWYFSSNPSPDIGLVLNIKYKRTILSLGSFIETLKIFWNDGNPLELTIDQLQRKGSTAHTTYSKLSYPPWGLIEKKRKRVKISCLSDRGIKFMNNELAVPEKIEKVPISDQWKGTIDSRLIYFKDL